MLNSLIVIQASPLRQHPRKLCSTSSGKNKGVAGAAMNKYEFSQYSIKKSSVTSSPLSSYLAGLIESDGSIIVPGKDVKSYKPFFEIAFLPLGLGRFKIS